MLKNLVSQRNLKKRKWKTKNENKLKHKKGNQETISKKLIDFCDLNWERQCLEFHKNKRQVRTASIEQVRKPINNKSIGAWKKYESYLSEMLLEFRS